MNSLVKVLMDRDGLTKDEALVLIEEARQALQNYLMDDDLVSAEEVCEEFFGLEPDYLDFLI